MTSDGFHQYFYDAENRLVQFDGTAGYCANGTGSAATACYIYDALGRRVQKTDYSNECTSSLSGYIAYLYDLSDHQIVVTSNGVNQCHDEIYAGGRHLASYISNIHFNLSDWLGTERVRANGTTTLETCRGLPFGDGLSCSETDPDNPYASPFHFTGKERDLETASPFGGTNGLDYFGARYDASRLGRFMSPDPDGTGAFPDNPQSWNAYAYVMDQPLNNVDPEGLSGCEKDPEPLCGSGRPGP